jgi:hypothetical protein
MERIGVANGENWRGKWRELAWQMGRIGMANGVNQLSNTDIGMANQAIDTDNASGCWREVT